MTDLLPFDVEVKPLRAPRSGATSGKGVPTWSDHRPKFPKDCDFCVLVAYETVMAGEPFPGIRKARRKRRQGGESVVLCSEHGQAQAALDDAA